MSSQPHSALSEGGTAIDFEDLFRIAPIGLAVLDPDLRFVRVNELLAEMNGFSPEAHVGKTIAEIVPSVANEVEAPFRSVFETDISRLEIRIAGETPRAPGQRRTWVESVRPLKDRSGTVRHILVSVQETTALEAAEASLRETERTLRASQQLSPDGFTILKAVRDPNGAVVDFTWEYVNPAAEAALKAGPLAGRRLLELVPGNREHPDLFPRYVRLLGRSEPDEVELEYESDGIRGWFRNSAVSLGDDRLAVGFRDITARKRIEEQLRLTSREMKHRVKNVIAITTSVVVTSARYASDVPSFVDSLSGRLRALAAAQDLLRDDPRATADLLEIVRAATEPFSNRSVEVVPGPSITLDGAAAAALVLAINELATNAVKYGALSVADGHATIAWEARDGRAELRWDEHGGPAVAPPARKGFGTKLLHEAARQLPGGKVEVLFEHSGLQARFMFDTGNEAPQGFPLDGTKPG